MSSTGPSEFSRKTFRTFVLRVLTQILSVAGGIIIARSLGPSGKGMYTYALAALAVLTTVSGGMSASISRQYRRLKRPSGVVYSGMMRFFFVAIVPLSIVLAAIAFFTHEPALLFTAVAFPFAYFNQASVSFSMADGKVGFANYQSLISTAGITVVTGILCYVLHLNVFAALAGWTGVTLAVSVYSFFNIAKYRRDFGNSEQRGKVFREQVKYGFHVTFNALLAHLNFQIDIFIVLFLLGHAALGRYSIAVGIGQLMWFLSRPLAIASYGPVTKGNSREAARVTVACVRHALINVGVAAVILAVVGPILIRFVYGPAFTASGLAFQLLLPGILAYCTVPFFSQYFSLHLGKPGNNSLVLASSTIICGIFTYFMAPHWGILAGAVGTSLSYVAALIIASSMFCRETGVPFRELVAFTKRDIDQYRTLARWVLSGAQAR